MFAENNLRERDDGTLDHVAVPPNPEVVPEWRTILATIDYSTITTHEAAHRVLDARHKEWAHRYALEYGAPAGEWDMRNFDAHNTTLATRGAVAELDKARVQLSIGGRIIDTRELPPDTQAAMWRAFAEHGSDPAHWPVDVQRAILHAPPKRTHGELFDERRAVLANEERLEVRRVIEQLGANPAKWTVDALDAVALAAGRVRALDALRAEAIRLDSEWHKRKVDHAPPVVVTKTSAELAADAAALEQEKVLAGHYALAGAVHAAEFTLQQHDAETEMLSRLAVNDCTLEWRATRKRERTALAKKLEAARDELEKAGQS